jgi:hypothetical protein
LSSYIAEGAPYWKRNKTRAFIENAWFTTRASAAIKDTSTHYQFRLYTDITATDNTYLLMYVTDFQLVKGAIRNDEIIKLKTGSSSGGLFGGSKIFGN